MMFSEYEVLYSNDPSIQEEKETFKKYNDALRRARELAKEYSHVELEKVYYSQDGDDMMSRTYEDFEVKAEWENGKKVGIVNAKIQPCIRGRNVSRF